MFYRARYFDANTGRFLSEDPIGFNGRDQKLYRYVRNNPPNFVDSDGQFAEALFGPLSGFFEGAAATGEAASAGVIAPAALVAALTVLATPSEAGAGSDVVPNRRISLIQILLRPNFRALERAAPIRKRSPCNAKGPIKAKNERIQINGKVLRLGSNQDKGRGMLGIQELKSIVEFRKVIDLELVLGEVFH